MYILAPGIKEDPVRRWALPDRVFFACGACHVLAHAFLERYRDSGFFPVWQRPAEGFTGNHIFLTRGDAVFDYHGYSDRTAFLTHTAAKANRWWPGWRAELVPLPPHILVSEVESRKYEGLWLREPKQFLHDALPRARAFLARLPPPPRNRRAGAAIVPSARAW